MKIALSKLKSHPDNPRVIKDEKYEQLKKSIDEFPEMLSVRPIVVDENNIVLGGNMRLAAMKELGLKSTNVIVAKDLTEEQKQQFLIKDNLSFGDWDWDVLYADYKAEDLRGMGIDVWIEDTGSNLQFTNLGGDEPATGEEPLNNKVNLVNVICPECAHIFKLEI